MSVSASLPESERRGVEEFVQRHGIRHRFITTDELANPLYVTNNSAGDVNAQVGCTFTNGGRSVQETRVIVPTAGPGQRLGMPVYGPRTDVFVDRVLCRVLTP